MTDKQPKALRLADKLEHVHGHRLVLDAAAELRRLHQSEREAWRYADELEQERKRLHEVNAELVDALKQIMLWIENWDPEFSYDPDWPFDRDAAKAALRKAQGDNNE